MKRLLGILFVLLGGTLQVQADQLYSYGVKKATEKPFQKVKRKAATEQQELTEAVSVLKDPQSEEYWSETEGWKINPNVGR